MLQLFLYAEKNKLPIVVFNSLEEGNIKKVIMGEKIGTVVVAD